MFMGTLICSPAGLRTRVNEPVGQVDTHSPQPMHRMAFVCLRLVSKYETIARDRDHLFAITLSFSFLIIRTIAQFAEPFPIRTGRFFIPQFAHDGPQIGVGRFKFRVELYGFRVIRDGPVIPPLAFMDDPTMTVSFGKFRGQFHEIVEIFRRYLRLP
jgi:hypothetical protein